MRRETSRITIIRSSAGKSVVEHWQNAIKQGLPPRATCSASASRTTRFTGSGPTSTNESAVRRISRDVGRVVVRGDLGSGNYLACYLNNGRIDAAVGLNRAKDVRRIMPLIKARGAVNLDELRDERVDLRSVSISSGPRGPL